MLFDPSWKAKPVKPSAEAWRVALREAAAWLYRHRWNRGHYNHPDGSSCLMGALQKVAPSRQVRDSAYAVLSDHLGHPPEMWNDFIAKDKKQVIAMLKEVAGKELWKDAASLKKGRKKGRLSAS